MIKRNEIHMEQNKTKPKTGYKEDNTTTVGWLKPSATGKSLVLYVDKPGTNEKGYPNSESLGFISLETLKKYVAGGIDAPKAIPLKKSNN